MGRHKKENKLNKMDAITELAKSTTVSIVRADGTTEEVKGEIGQRPDDCEAGTQLCDFCSRPLLGEQLPDTQPIEMEWCGKEGWACSFCQFPGRAQRFNLAKNTGMTIEEATERLDGMEGAGKRDQLLTSDISVDAAGNVYIVCDNRVLRFDAHGQQSTVAGQLEPGYDGDGNLAIQAKLNAPSSIAVRSNGEIYILDSGNGVIRKVDRHGNITTFGVIK